MQKQIYKNKKSEPLKILLLSGGSDSMLLCQRYEFDEKIFFDYGQLHIKEEFEKCEKFITKIIKLPKFCKRDKEINIRNFNFIVNIVSIYGSRDLEIYIGTNAEDKYKDNNRDFYNKLQKFISDISFHEVNIVTPLINMNKKDILNELKLSFYTD